jgi:amino acid adenylation domain-containing protein
VPLSFAQRRLWFLAQLEPESAAYHIYQAQRLQGPLNVEALQKALDTVVARHEALRTTFPVQDGEPFQDVHAPSAAALRTVELCGLVSDREAELKRILGEEVRRPFDLTQGPLFRGLLVRVGAADHVLLLTLHHIVSDGWSMGVLMDELVCAYNAACRHTAAVLPPLPVQYADYAIWERERFKGPGLRQQLAYWKQHLAGAPEALSLPLDYPRPARRTLRGAGVDHELSSALSAALHSLARQERSSLFMVLSAAFQLLLHRLSGQDDIVIGTPVAGRDRVEIEGLIGLFLNTLVLRTDLSGNPTFQQLLAWVHDVVIEALAHQDVPFDMLVEELHPQRSLNNSPLFQVMLNLFVDRTGTRVWEGLTTQPWEIGEVESKFDFTLYVRRHEGKLKLVLVYHPDLFRAERMTELLRQFEQLLESIVASPHARIGSYSLVTAPCRSLLPDPCKPLPLPSVESAPVLVLARGRSQPGAVAVKQSGESWSYSQLVGRATALVAHLQEAGLHAGDVVAVTGARSFNLIAGLAGVLASGGVLLSLDPALPARRIRLMLESARARFLVPADDRAVGDDVLQVVADLKLVVVGVPEETRLDSTPVANLTDWPSRRPEDPAYLFFTSGTKGVPKAVLGSHQGLGHFLAWQRDTFQIGQGDRSAQLTGLSFDVVLRDVFTPLAGGGTLCLPDQDCDMTGGSLSRWFSSEQITLLHTVPTLAQRWLDEFPDGFSLPSLRLVFFAGEPLTDTLVRRWRAAFPNARVINLYGPTETTLAKCWYEVPDPPVAGVQPVGSPLPQTQALVLSKGGRLCGLGEPGEIVLRTPFRTLGYANSAEETKRRFVANPFRTDPDDLLYRTSDRGRYRLDGSVDILGREDDQVKVRGVRVEPAEVCAVLARHEQVKAAVVVPRQDEQGQTWLCAYVASDRQDAGLQEELRRHVSRELPPAMVPAAIVVMPMLPTGENGKVDRQRLPQPDLSAAQAEKPAVPPRNDPERKVARVWQEVLKVGRISVQDDFFDLGGHSLLALQLLARLRLVFKIDLPARLLFENPTIAGLAETIQRHLVQAETRTVTSRSWLSLTPIQSRGNRRPLYLVPGGVGGEEEFIVYAPIARELGEQQPSYGLKARGLDGVTIPHSDVRTMAADYIQEIRQLQPDGPYLIAGECHGGVAAYEIAQQLREQGQEVRLLALLDAVCPFRTQLLLYRWRLIEAFLAQTALVRVLHHLLRLPAVEPGRRWAYLRAHAAGVFDRLHVPPKTTSTGYLVAEYKKHGDSYRRTLYRYRPQPYFGKITVLANQAWLKVNPTLGWDRYAKGGLEIIKLPGDHLSYLREHAAKTASELRRILEEVQNG